MWIKYIDIYKIEFNNLIYLWSSSILFLQCNIIYKTINLFSPLLSMICHEYKYNLDLDSNLMINNYQYYDIKFLGN